MLWMKFISFSGANDDPGQMKTDFCQLKSSDIWAFSHVHKNVNTCPKIPFI